MSIMLSHIRVAVLAAALMVVAGADDANAAQHYRRVHVFLGGEDGKYPGPTMVEAGGKLYGVTSDGTGQLFSMDPTTRAKKTLHTFGAQGDGSGAMGSLLNVDGVIYGTTTQGGNTNGSGFTFGTVFAFDTATSTYSILYKFSGIDGMYPLGGLINVGDELYGTTQEGGSNQCPFGCGTVFSVDRNTHAFKKLYDFQASESNFPAATMMQAGGKLYGTTQGGEGLIAGSVFSVNLHNDQERTTYQFYDIQGPVQPIGGLVEVDGLLYGTSDHGGQGTGCNNNKFGCGTIYTVDPKTRAMNVVYAFEGSSDGAKPRSTLLNVDGVLYGTTMSGGACSDLPYAGCGTVFRFNPKTGLLKTVYTFRGGYDGELPVAGLINVNGTLYGTTSRGGRARYGTVFALDP